MAEELEFRDREALRAWLRDKPVAWSRAIATRAALRVLPLIGDSSKERLILGAVRATFISWAAGKYPAYDLRADATAARAAAALFADDDAAADVLFAARAAARAAAVNSAARATAAGAAAAAGHAADALFGADAAAWNALSQDARWLSQRKGKKGGVTGLLAMPLWPDRPPHGPLSAWSRFTGGAVATKGGYAPWIAWYEALLPLDAKAGPKDFFDEELTIRIAAQPGGWWKRGAAAVNADIAAWLTEEYPKPEPGLQNALEALPAPSRAPVVALWRDGRIETVRSESAPEHPDIAQGLLEDLRAGTVEALESLQRSNCDGRLLPALRGLAEILPERIADLDQGLFYRRAIPVAAVAKVLNSPESRKEVSDGVIFGVLAVDMTVDRLRACFSELRTLDAKVSAPGLTIQNAPVVKDTLDNIAGAFNASPIAGHSATESLKEFSDTSAATDDAQNKLLVLYNETAGNVLLETFRFDGTPPGKVVEELKAPPETRSRVVAGVAAFVKGIPGSVIKSGQLITGSEKIWEVIKWIWEIVNRHL